MTLDIKAPAKTDPIPDFGDDFKYQWLESKEPNVYYSWVYPVTENVKFHATLKPVECDLRNGVRLQIYRSPTKQELLYRIKYSDKKPSRFLVRPQDYTIFWSYGKAGGPSDTIKSLFKDRFLSIHEWVDKNSFLAVLRQEHYRMNEGTFWSR